MYSHFFVGYYSGLKGEVCKDESHVIRSKMECIEAIEKVGFQIKNRNFRENRENLSRKNIPTGCSFRNDNGRPHFEKSLTGFGIGRADLTPVCYAPSNSGNLYQMVVL